MKGKYIKIGLLVLLAVVFIVAMVKISVEKAREEKYNETMSVLRDPQSVPVKGNKMVTFLDDEFTRLYIPEQWQAENPEEARYILYCEDSNRAVGTYTGGGTGYVVTRTVTVYDRQTGMNCSQERFVGDYPPSTVKESPGEHNDHYGLVPKEDITEWLENLIPKLDQ